MTPFPAHQPRFSQELTATLRLAVPIALAQLAQIAMGTTDTVLLGALGRDALAAGGLGAMLFFTLASVMQGILSAVGILVAHARGAGKHGRIGAVLRVGSVLGLVLSIPVMVLLWNAEPVLLWLGEPHALSEAVGRYDRILVWATPALMAMATQRAYLAAMTRPGLILWVTVTALVVNGVLNYGLIHGAFGLPEMGYLGSSTATAITVWAQCGVIALGMRLNPALKDVRPRGLIDLAILRELLALGWPIAITIGVETLLFLIGGLMMGLVGTTALAAHQVTLNVAAMMFMVPLGVAQAANVRVGYHTGAGVPRAARRAGFAAFVIGVVFAAVSATVILAGSWRIALLFGLKTGNAADAEVIALAGHLLTICALFQLFDGTQTIAAGALRGLKDTRVPMLLAGFGYWVCGFPVAWYLGFPAGLGATGIWWGLALGLLVAAVLLGARFWVVSDRKLDRAAFAGATAEDAARQAMGPSYPAAAE